MRCSIRCWAAICAVAFALGCNNGGGGDGPPGDDLGLDGNIDAAPPVDAAPDSSSGDENPIRLVDQFVPPPDMGAPADMAAPRPDLGPQLPDLLLLADRLAGDVWLDEKTFSPDDCAVVEGCIDQPGHRLLLRFSVATANIGDADLVMGRPEDNVDLYQYSQCHEHYHFEQYAEYALMSAEEVVSVGRKQAFCLLDSERHLADDPTVRDRSRYHCGFQGISRGWQDTYGSHLDCQWIDVTDLMPGGYDLSVHVNPAHIIQEKSYENNQATVPVSVPVYDIGAPCELGATVPEGTRRSCGWRVHDTGRCERGDVVELGCGGCGDFGPVCEGDPMLRVCDGEGTQCLPSSALGQRNGGCDDSPCPHLEFPCPDSGVYTIWTAPNVDGEPYVCDLAVRTGPPQIERACENDGEEGLERTCGWHAAQIDGDCLPGFMYHVGCNPDGEGCNIGQACAGDPIMRVCPGDTPCLSASALAQNDDSCNNYCPSTTFECPLGGRFSVFTGSYRDGRDYTCEVTAERVQ